MSMDEILAFVKAETGLSVSDWHTKNPPREIFYPKWVAILMMHEEGYRNPEIAEIFKCHKNYVCNAIAKAKEKLADDKAFKKLYLACIKRMADAEWAESEVQKCA